MATKANKNLSKEKTTITAGTTGKVEDVVGMSAAKATKPVGSDKPKKEKDDAPKQGPFVAHIGGTLPAISKDGEKFDAKIDELGHACCPTCARKLAATDVAFQTEEELTKAKAREARLAEKAVEDLQRVKKMLAQHQKKTGGTRSIADILKEAGLLGDGEDGEDEATDEAANG